MSRDTEEVTGQRTMTAQNARGTAGNAIDAESVRRYNKSIGENLERSCGE